MKIKSLIELLDYFKEEETAIKHYEDARWNGNPTCPHCGTGDPYKTNRGWKCSDSDCYKKFTVRVGTIFQNSKMPLRLWFAAIFLATNHKKGISSLQLASDLGITQKSAWYMLHRIREMLKKKEEIKIGINTVEVDETYVGGKEGNKHYKKKRSDENKDLTNEGTPYVPKKTVIGVIERNGNVVLDFVEGATEINLSKFISKYVILGSRVYTDEFRGYSKLKNEYKHRSVKHSASIYVEGDVHTNTIENFWSLLKRGIVGIYHQVSNKHIKRYLNEFSERFNTRHMHTMDRINHFLGQSECYLSYKELIAE